MLLKPWVLLSRLAVCSMNKVMGTPVHKHKHRMML